MYAYVSPWCEDRRVGWIHFTLTHHHYLTYMPHTRIMAYIIQTAQRRVTQFWSEVKCIIGADTYVIYGKMLCEWVVKCDKFMTLRLHWEIVLGQPLLGSLSHWFTSFFGCNAIPCVDAVYVLKIVRHLMPIRKCKNHYRLIYGIVSICIIR